MDGGGRINFTEHTKEQKEEAIIMGDTVTEISPSAQTWLGTFDPEEGEFYILKRN